NIPCIILLISFSLQFSSAQKTLQQNRKYHIKRSSFYKLVKEYKAQKTTTRTDKNDGYVERK
ncbi:hypothetical protein NPM18_30155, partial [Bacillus cereus]|nr:hypothetical protein [Bacillus cereus]MCQ6318661.1 hypothetical protein [Bacillus cereus]MCQ6331230.1 hypothetical protein [Bacillus cereus]MCQ6386199.1 hypothetical protein [Bacillus cereus]